MTADEPYRVSDTRARPAPAPRFPVERVAREEPARPALGARSDDNVRLGLWGATGGGKTTFLAALRVAAELGGWRMHGLTKHDSDFLHHHWRQLYEEQRFPVATVLEAVIYHWLLNGDPAAVTGRRLWRRSKPVQFVLEMQDISGAVFKVDTADTSVEEAEIRRNMLRHLAASDGLVYLFDPMRDLTAARPERNIGYFHGVIEQLEAMLAPTQRLVNGRLPHSLAVCVSKFDDPAIFTQAYQQGWVNFGADGSGMPRVLDEHAKDFFYDFICTELRVDSAALLRRLIENHFLPERVKYFVTSSIGFYLKNGEFDDLDFSNVIAEGESLRIRDEIRPINVLEPLVALERRVRTGRW